MFCPIGITVFCLGMTNDLLVPHSIERVKDHLYKTNDQCLG